MNNQTPENQKAQEQQTSQSLRPLEDILNRPENAPKLIVPQEAFARMHGYEDE